MAAGKSDPSRKKLKKRHVSNEDVEDTDHEDGEAIIESDASSLYDEKKPSC